MKVITIGGKTFRANGTKLVGERVERALHNSVRQNFNAKFSHPRSLRVYRKNLKP